MGAAVQVASEEAEVASVADLGESNSEEIRQQIMDLRSKIDDSYWEFAEALHVVWRDTLYLEWGFDDWTKYVEEELDYKLRTAQYLVGIIDYFGKMPANVQTWVKSLGWTKAKLLVKKVDADNWKEVRKQIKGKSVVQITEYLSGGSGKSEKVKVEDDNTEKPARKAFSLYADQLANVEAAVAKAKEDADSDKDGHALDLICTSYLSLNPGERSMSDFLASYEKVFGVRLIAVSSDDEIVYGESTLDALVPEEDDG